MAAFVDLPVFGPEHADDYTCDSLDTRIKKTISALVRDWEDFKVGITNDSLRRAREHDDFDELVPVYRTSDIEDARDLEALLIDFYGERYDESDGFWNQVGGGGGAVGEGEYTVYVLRDGWVGD